MHRHVREQRQQHGELDAVDVMRRDRADEDTGASVGSPSAPRMAAALSRALAASARQRLAWGCERPVLPEVNATSTRLIVARHQFREGLTAGRERAPATDVVIGDTQHCRDASP